MGLERYFKFREQDASKPFMDHLEDLRWMLIKIVVTLMAGMALCFAFRTELVQVLQKPLHDIDPTLVTNLQVLSPMDSLVISFKLAFYAGIVITFPLLMFFVAQFVLPALTLKEKKFLLPGIAFGFALFGAGVCFSYFYVFPETLAFFFKDALSMGWKPAWTAQRYFSFATQITLALGLAFELPIVVLALNYLGYLSSDLMRRTRIFAVPILMVLAALIAPSPDPFTMLSIGGPMCLLYEFCIWLTWGMEKRREKKRIANTTNV